MTSSPPPFAAGRSKLRGCSRLRVAVAPFVEGDVAQIMHIGPYAEERPTIRRLHASITDAGFLAARRPPRDLPGRSTEVCARKVAHDHPPAGQRGVKGGQVHPRMGRWPWHALCSACWWPSCLQGGNVIRQLAVCCVPVRPWLDPCDVPDATAQGDGHHGERRPVGLRAGSLKVAVANRLGTVRAAHAGVAARGRHRCRLLCDCLGDDPVARRRPVPGPHWSSGHRSLRCC